MAGMMNPEAKALLVDALRSGDYEQGAGYLRMPLVDEASGNSVDAFCCLGVLCDIAVKHDIDLDVVRGGALTSAYSYDNETAYLPTKVQEWAGLNDVGDFPADVEWDSGEQVYTSLIEANDDGKSFSEIADFIEKEF